MKPEKSDVEDLNSWTDRQFGDWIKGSLHDYLVGKLGRFAFKPLQTFFGEEYDVIEEIMSVFDLLTEQGKGRFKSGLSIALAETELSEDSVLDAILNLARRTAATHLLRIFSLKVLEAWQARRVPDPELDHAIVWTVGTLARFAGQSSLTDESISCIEAMARSDKMPKEYVLPLFKLLYEVRPKLPAENLEKFWYLLDFHFGQQVPFAPIGDEKIREALVASVFQASGRDGLLATIIPREPRYSYSWWQEETVSFLIQRKISIPLYDNPEAPKAKAEPLITQTEIDADDSPELPVWMAHLRLNMPSAFAELQNSSPSSEEAF